MPKKSKQKGQKQKKGQREPYFVQPLTGKRFKRELKSAERLEFQPEKRQLQAESRASREQERRIQDYFDAYGQAAAQAGQTSSAATQTALNQISAQTAASSAGDAALRQTLEEAAKADAARRGVAYDPSGAATSMASSASRRGAADTFGALTATQGASQAGYLADKRRIGEGERINQTLREQARGRSINQDKRALAEARKDFRRDYRSRTRETERQFHLENLALADAAAGRSSQMALARQYGRNERKAQKRSVAGQLTVAERQAQLKRAEQRRSVGGQLTVAERQARNARADDRRSRKYARKFGGPAEAGGPSDSDVRRALGYLRSAPKGAYSDRKSATDYLINRGVSPAAARAAVRRAQPKPKESGTGQTVNATVNR